MLCKTFWTQWHHPVRGDWVLPVKEDLEIFEIPSNLTWIKSKSKLSFKSIVRSKAKELGLTLLLNMKEKQHIFYLSVAYLITLPSIPQKAKYYYSFILLFCSKTFEYKMLDLNHTICLAKCILVWG